MGGGTFGGWGRGNRMSVKTNPSWGYMMGGENGYFPEQNSD